MVVAYDPLADSYLDLEPAQREVLLLADGKTTVEEIHGALEDAGLDQGLEEVRDFLSEAAARGLMTLSSLRKEVRLRWPEARRARVLARSFQRALQAHPLDAFWRGAAESAAGHLRRPDDQRYTLRLLQDRGRKLVRKMMFANGDFDVDAEIVGPP